MEHGALKPDRGRGAAPGRWTARRYWNAWWTLSVIFLTLSAVVAILEHLGVLEDLGGILTVMGVGIALFFGLTGATRTSVMLVGDAVVAVVSEVGAVALGFGRVERGLDRIERVLIERLPPG